MNSFLFLILFLAGFGWTLAIERKRLRDVPAAYKAVYCLLASLSLAMLVLYWFGIVPPMPTRLVSKYIAPYVEFFVKGDVP